MKITKKFLTKLIQEQLDTMIGEAYMDEMAPEEDMHKMEYGKPMDEMGGDPFEEGLDEELEEEMTLEEELEELMQAYEMSHAKEGHGKGHDRSDFDDV
jgi:CO dehydrogenase/acetyl-CoA synthase beta subunit